MSDRSGPGILSIALAVALGIGIAHDDGWLGNDADAAPADADVVTTEQIIDAEQIAHTAPSIALKP